MEAKKTFLSRNLKFLRKLKGLTQNKVANDLGLSRNKIASYESGIAEPKILNFVKLTTYFNIDPTQLLTQDLSDKPIAAEIGSPTFLKDEISNHLNDMITATQELQKIIEGYKLFQEMTNIQAPGDVESKVLTSQLYNIIELNESLLSVNWEFIRAIIPFEEE